MKKKTILILLIVSILLIGIGLVLMVTISNERQDKNLQKSPETNQQEKPREKADINKNPDFQEEHCLENLCIDKLNVLNEKEMGISVVDGLLLNKSAVDVPEGYIKIEFDVEGEVYSKVLKHQMIPANGKTVLMWQHKEKKLLKSIKYRLLKPTEAEIIEKKAEEQKAS